jgi:hypothetical protein
MATVKLTPPCACGYPLVRYCRVPDKSCPRCGAPVPWQNGAGEA